MGEVGEHGIAFHREIGEYARAASLERLLAIGPLAAHAVAAFGPGAEHFSDVDVLAAAVRGALRPDVTVLIKGSRFMRMERVVSALTGEAAEAH